MHTHIITSTPDIGEALQSCGCVHVRALCMFLCEDSLNMAFNSLRSRLDLWLLPPLWNALIIAADRLLTSLR